MRLCIFGYKLSRIERISLIASLGPLSTSLSGIGSGLGMPTVSSDVFSARKMSTPGLNPPTFQQSKIKACKWCWSWESAMCLKLYFLLKVALSASKSFWHFRVCLICIIFICGPKKSKFWEIQEEIQVSLHNCVMFLATSLDTKWWRENRLFARRFFSEVW